MTKYLNSVSIKLSFKNNWPSRTSSEGDPSKTYSLKRANPSYKLGNPVLGKDLNERCNFLCYIWMVEGKVYINHVLKYFCISMKTALWNLIYCYQRNSENNFHFQINLSQNSIFEN